MSRVNKKLIKNYNKGYFAYPANIIIHTRTVIKMELKNSRRLRVHVSCRKSTRASTYYAGIRVRTCIGEIVLIADTNLQTHVPNIIELVHKQQWFVMFVTNYKLPN